MDWFNVLWIAGIGGAVFIYFVILPEGSKAEVRRFLKSWGVWLFLFLGWLYFHNKWGYWGPDEWLGNKANSIFFFLAIGWALARNFLERERYHSTQAIADNRSGSCAKYQELEDYVVLNIGSVDADLFPWSMGHETWVVRKRHFNKINGKINTPSQILCESQLVQCDLTEVPPSAHDFIETSFGYNKDVVFYGEFSQAELISDAKIELGTTSVNTKEYQKILKDTQRMLNEARSMLKGKLSAVKRFVSDVGTTLRKASGQSVIPSVTKPVGSEANV